MKIKWHYVILLTVIKSSFIWTLTLTYNSFCTTWNIIYRDNLKPTGVNQKQNPIKELEAKFKKINNNNSENEEETPTFNFQVRPNDQNKLWTWQQYFVLYWVFPYSYLLQLPLSLAILGLNVLHIYLGIQNSYSA